MSDDRDTATYTALPSGHTWRNVTDLIRHQASVRPEETAIVVCRRAVKSVLPNSFTYANMWNTIERAARALVRSGFRPGERVLLMVKPGMEFVILTFALMKAGCVPVLIDPGMGVQRMINCLDHIKPDALVVMPQVFVLSLLRRGLFAHVNRTVTVGSRWACGGVRFDDLLTREASATDKLDLSAGTADDMAAILFTSGSTGPPKGADYHHSMLIAQVLDLQRQYAIQPGEVDLSTFAMFALFAPAMGMTSVIPSMDFRRPARVNPRMILQTVEHYRVTNMFGSPAMWTTLLKKSPPDVLRRSLASVRRVLIAGAPVMPWIVKALLEHLPSQADVFTPYGATEALPVASIGGRELARGCFDAHHAGRGTCIGKAVPGRNVRIIRITDEPIPSWSDHLLVPNGVVGEIAVRGPVVTRHYHRLPHADRVAKIIDGNDVWHRMGDLGYVDEQNRIWFCGRKSQRVLTRQGELYTECVEGIFNSHPLVSRSALVGVGPFGQMIPVMVIELTSGNVPRGRKAEELTHSILTHTSAYPLGSVIHYLLFHPSLPVDIRHNAKIHREQLAAWATKQLATKRAQPLGHVLEGESS